MERGPTPATSPEWKKPVASPEWRKPSPSKPATGVATVTVGCKVPNGLTLRVFKMVPAFEQVFGGGQKEVEGGRAEQVGESIKLRGGVLDPKVLRKGRLPANAPIGGFGLTHGVPMEFMELWFKQNADSDIVRNGLIFYHESQHSAADMAGEREAEESGYEPIDPDNPSKRSGMREIVRGERPPGAAA